MEAANIDSLAALAQGTIVDIEIEDRGTGVAFGAGAVVSFRIWADVKPEAVVETAPELHVFIVPAGEGIPAIASDAQLKQSQHFHWAMKKFSSVSADPAATAVFFMEMEIKTARRYRQGDRFVVQLKNADSAVAFGAAAVAGILVDAYVRPD